VILLASVFVISIVVGDRDERTGDQIVGMRVDGRDGSPIRGMREGKKKISYCVGDNAMSLAR
jgi:hypothetical protein